MTNSTTDVAIIMGSDSDLPIVEAAFSILDSFGVNYTKNVMSAHRTPHEVMELIKTSENNGCKQPGLVFVGSKQGKPRMVVDVHGAQRGLYQWS